MFRWIMATNLRLKHDPSAHPIPAPFYKKSEIQMSLLVGGEFF